MYGSAYSMRFSRGRSTPAIRANRLLLCWSMGVWEYGSKCRYTHTPILPYPHTALPLPLLMLGVLANDAHDPFALDDLAFLADLLNRRSNLHGSLQYGHTKTRPPPS